MPYDTKKLHMDKMISELLDKLQSKLILTQKEKDDIRKHK